MSQNQLVSFPNRENKVSVKYNKPHCIIPISDITWITQQVKAVQTLWNECWASDPFGSRWEKLSTNLTETAFRLARKILYAAGLFEFKRDTCIHDSRKTAGWLVINLHGARRIKDFWMNEETEPISDINTTTSDINTATSDTNTTISDIKSTVEIVETPDLSDVSEPLSSISLSSQELLKEVPREEEIPTRQELLEKALARGGKIGEKLHRVLTNAFKHADGWVPTMKETLSDIFDRNYRWKIDDKRLNLVSSLDESSIQTFLSRFKFVWSDRGMSAPRTFDQAIRDLAENRFTSEDIKLQIQSFLLDLSEPQKKRMAFIDS